MYRILVCVALLSSAVFGVDRETGKRQAADAQRIIPHFAAGNEWTTTVRLINFENASAIFKLSVFDSKGNLTSVQINGSTASSYTATIPPRGLLDVVLTSSSGLKTGMLGIDFMGDIRLPFTVFFKTTAQMEGAVSYEEYPDQWLEFVQFDNTNGASTGIALADLRPLSTGYGARIEVTCYDHLGSELGTFAGLGGGEQQAAFDLGSKLSATRGAKGLCTFAYRSDYSSITEWDMAVLSLQFKGANFLPLK
ncbi:MAG: hypothetical protein HZB13_17755 [Acidobacteria bacterium]|nr:hypothetical protein [Acidobacteriota bacterium]